MSLGSKICGDYDNLNISSRELLLDSEVESFRDSDEEDVKSSYDYDFSSYNGEESEERTLANPDG